MPDPRDIPPAVPPPPETVEVGQRRVWCDGSEGALGHPRVFLEIDSRGFVDCPYCDRRFLLTGDGGATGH